MPWSCRACDLELRDDVFACPTCGSSKDAWTLHADRTRNLVVARQRVEAVRGGRFGGSATPEAEGASDVLITASRALAVRKVALRALAARGVAPGAGRLLVVRTTPKVAGPVRLLLEVQPSVGEPRTATLALEGQAGVPVEARVVLTYGDPAETIEPGLLPGHHALDVSDAGERGHAARLRVSLEGRQPVGVPILGEVAAWLAARLLLVRDGKAKPSPPDRRASCRVRPADEEDSWEPAEPDAEGILRQEVASHGSWRVEVTERRGRYSAWLEAEADLAEPPDLLLWPGDGREARRERRRELEQDRVSDEAAIFPGDDDAVVVA